jgi:hypothetical protein
VRLGGHRRAAVDLIEVGGSMPRLAGAHAGIDALLTATGQPAAVRGYFEGRLFGYGAPQSVREGTIARLRAALGELVGGADVDAAVTFRGPETVGRAAPLVDQEAIDLATLALAHQELLAGLGTRPVSQLIDVGTRRPGWRFSARVRLGHLVARTGPDAPLELLAKEEQLFYRMFGPHYASQQSYVRLMTPGSDVWKRSQLMALEQLQWNLSSADAWMTLGFHLLSRGGSDEDRRSLVDEHFAAVDRQLAGIPR